MLSDSNMDLAFNEQVLEDVEKQWKVIMGEEIEAEQLAFMRFEDRQGMNNDDEEEGDGY